MSEFKEISLRLEDGYEAYARFWSPRELRGAVVFHHGIQAHCGWYEGTPKRLMDAGYAVLQADRRGSGRNQQDRGHADSADQLVGDAVQAGNELLRRTGLRRYHVVGVSWGGKLAVAAYVSHPKATQSLSIVTPGLFPRPGASRSQKAKIGMAMIYEPRKRFPIPLNNPDLFTHSPTWREFFVGDPLALRECTAGFYLASRRMDKLVADLPKCQAVPLHLLLAGEERIIDNEKTARCVRELHWPSTRITTYFHSRHTLEFDVPDVYLPDLVGFIQAADGNHPVGSGREAKNSQETACG